MAYSWMPSPRLSKTFCSCKIDNEELNNRSVTSLGFSYNAKALVATSFPGGPSPVELCSEPRVV